MFIMILFMLSGDARYLGDYLSYETCQDAAKLIALNTDSGKVFCFKK
jgi:hypothetical protein